MRQLALKLIAFYQTHISPRKGFSCAHRVHNNSESCSNFAANAIRENGLFSGLMMTKNRLTECGEVSRTFRKNRPTKVANQSGFVDCDGCDGCDTCGDCVGCLDIFDSRKKNKQKNYYRNYK